mgnify:CR=1 FL=1
MHAALAPPPAVSGDRDQRLLSLAIEAQGLPWRVRKVNFTVENTRVGQDVDREKLILEIETDGTITPEAAVRKAAAILVSQFTAFSGLGEAPVAAPAAGP